MRNSKTKYYDHWRNSHAFMVAEHTGYLHRADLPWERNEVMSSFLWVPARPLPMRVQGDMPRSTFFKLLVARVRQGRKILWFAYDNGDTDDIKAAEDSLNTRIVDVALFCEFNRTFIHVED